MSRKLLLVTGSVLLFFLVAGCASLRTARIRKDVTVNTFQEPETKVKQGSTIAVIPTFHREEGVSGVSDTASEAAADMMSVKLWSQGFGIIDRTFIKDMLTRKKIEFSDISLNHAVLVGQALKSDYVMLISLTEHEEDSRSIDFGPFHVVNTVDTSVLVGLNCRLVDVDSGRIVWSGVGTTQDRNLQLCMRRIAEQLIYTFNNNDGSIMPKEREVPVLKLVY